MLIDEIRAKLKTLIISPLDSNSSFGSLQKMFSDVTFCALSIGHNGFAIGRKINELSPKNSISAGVRELLAGSVYLLWEIMCS